MVAFQEIPKPMIAGILNLTSDSFSDGGQFLDVNRAISQAEKLIEDGADVIELGPASTHPDAEDIDSEIEILRIKPVLEELVRRDIPVAIDSFQPKTQLFCLNYPINYINDVQSFIHPEIYDELSKSDVKLVMMHSVQNQARALRLETDISQIIEKIIKYFEERISTLEESGISRNRLILDPGMGFFLGSNPEVSLIVLNHIEKLKKYFNLPLFISTSRKSFLGKISNKDVDQREYSTLASEIFAIQSGADYIRTHTPGKISDFISVWNEIKKYS